MQSGDLLDLDVTAVAHGGVFVARHENRVVFLPDTLPGERVRARLTDTRKSSFWRADVLEVLDASADRRPHIWAPADVTAPPEARPGGADFGHIALARQRELKAEVVRDGLARFARSEVPVTIEPPLAQTLAGRLEGEVEDATGWRTRVSLHVDDEGRVGPFAARSHRVIPVDDHPLATAAIARAAARHRGGAEGRLDLVQPADGRVRVIPRPADGRRRTPADPAAREVVTELAGGREFRVDAGGFWQVHRLAAGTLHDAVGDAVRGAVDPDAWHLDLYGGVGLLAASVAAEGGESTRITTIESDARATEHAGENLSEWIGARAETARVERWLGALAGTASSAQRDRLRRGVVVLDPPRSGAGREVVERIAALEPARIVYVACDPVALARDLGTFAALGYDAPSVRAFDLFPHSHHVEAIAVLTR
ncbi:TRAM domain-containing protein [Microbacterium sp. EYE_5]|uniref:class I SAM-dependent RNA methyltransferase n=1 Tax=unclassified Microbacterium TaxID=2609290 RepID=UPI00200392AE|nr:MULTISPECIES: TRAM domain-containing protein [unclassified Microbacterium]MCK6081538.1 TRAM domain-containing protein [Microbacterium sp. EYE_382]MCK6086808.1 TRAM domain-containing protein [Microbacterium sp. EYE_384]MCK6123694.1 TRAM domain-containing protein [Microbacterium sp. EYE_80]MCK6126603.1 TRAM domain-containing protein [Microbacterium sp. EYE_79]MCK6142492.1 TRAM domain-containing protein [Microbacterium sp. EYE_39]